MQLCKSVHTNSRNRETTEREKNADYVEPDKIELPLDDKSSERMDEELVEELPEDEDERSRA